MSSFRRVLRVGSGSVVVVGVGTIFFLFWAALFYTWTTDDSFITYRFSENLAAGEGLVFNPGEVVEGFSNPLWMTILAVGSTFGIGPMVLSKLLGALSLIGILMVADKIVLVADVSLAHRLLLAVVIAGDTSVAIYTFAGLETVFYGFLILLFTLLNVTYVVQGRDRLVPILLSSLAILTTRPEGILYPGIFLLWYFSRALKKREKGSSLNGIPGAHWMGLFGFAGSLLVLLAMRYAFFADLVPNTFYAKPTGSFGREFPTGGIAYLDEAVKNMGYVWPLLLLLYFFNIKRQELSEYRFVLARSIAPLVVFSFYAGGDWMPNSRFLVPVFPLVYVLGITILHDVMVYFRHHRFRWPVVILGVLAICVSIGHQYDSRLTVYQGRDRIPYDLMNAGENAKPLGVWLKERFEPSCVLATKRIGVVPYYSNLRTLDLYGLIDKEIARFIHEGGSFRDKAVAIRVRDSILERKPSLIILHSANPADFTPHGILEEMLLEGMGDDYRLVGDYAFSKTFINRVFLRKAAVSPEAFSSLQDDFRHHLRAEGLTRAGSLPDGEPYPIGCDWSSKTEP